jgi:hypothetical protein
MREQKRRQVQGKAAAAVFPGRDGKRAERPEKESSDAKPFALSKEKGLL